MDDETLRQRKKSTDTETTASSDATTASTTTALIPPNLSPKEAYFELLRVWVNQANLCHNAMACFPYYLAANYPQLFQHQRSSTEALLGHSVPIVNQPQPQNIPEPQNRPRFELFGNNDNRNQQRNEESMYSIAKNHVIL